MSTTTTFNGRISLKYDTYDNWTKNNITPLEGELCVTVVPAETGAVVQEPAILFKVGDGVKAYKDLPFTSAHAADIYDWAKAATKPAYSANEIAGLADYIAGKVQDTNTQYKIEADADDPRTFHLYFKEINGTWTKQNSYTIPAETIHTLVTGDTNGTVKFDGNEVAVAGLKSAAYQEASEFDVAGAADHVKTKLIGYEDDASSKTTIYGAKKAAAEALAAAQNAAGVAATAFKSGKVDGNTVSFYTSTDSTGAAAFTFDFPTEMFLDQTKTVFVPSFTWAESTYPGSVNPNLNSKPVMVLAVKGDDDSVTYSFLNMAALVDTYAAKTTGKDASTTIEISGYEVEVKVNISPDANNQLQKKDNGLYVPPVDLSGKADKVAGATSGHFAALDANGNLTDSGKGAGDFSKVEESEANGHIKVNGKEVTVYEHPETHAISEISGLQNALDAKANDADLAAIAKSGNVSDLQQTTGTYFVINCGSSSEVI